MLHKEPARKGRFFMVVHPWRPPLGLSLRDVKNGSRPFFILA